MKLIIVAGSPACGKTSILLKTINYLQNKDAKIAVAKLDCLKTNDDEIYKSLKIPVIKGLSNNLCPDHFLATNIEGIFNWAIDNNAEYLIIETAGLCNRCAPFTERALNICVVDCMSSIKAPDKLGPMVTTADVLIISKGDMISQAEREVFIYHLSLLNNKATIIEANGITGSQCHRIGNIILGADSCDSLYGDKLKHSMPSAICSYCVGEIRIGNAYHQGMVSEMDFPKRSEYAYV